MTGATIDQTDTFTDIPVTETTIEDDVAGVEPLCAQPQLVEPNALTVAGEELPAVGESRALSPAEQVLGMIGAAARDPSVDVSKMRELFGLQKDLMAMQAEQEFTAAFHRLDLPRIKKNGQVEYKDKKTGVQEKAFRFATYEDIDSAIRPLLRAEGFAISFDTVPRQGDGGGIIVTGTLSHTGGHKRTASIPVPLDISGGKNNVQGYGSAMSYGKRYVTIALCNIVAEGEDDDGKRGGTTYIVADQVLEMQATALAAEREEARFLETYTTEARSFEEVEEKDFIRLMRLLTSAKRQVDQRKAAEAQRQ